MSTLKAFQEIDTSETNLNVISETIDLPRRTDIPDRISELELEQAKLLESLIGTTLNFKTFLPLYIKYACAPEFPLDHVSRYMKSESIDSDDFLAMDSMNRKMIEKYLASVSTMEKLARIQDKIATLKKHKQINDDSGEDTISAIVQGIKIGDCVLITSPAELLVEVGLNIKKASSCEHTFVAALSNGYVHYGAPADAYDRGGYEVTECLLAPEWQQIYENKALEIIRRL